MGKKVLHVITGLGDGGAEGVLSRICLNSHGAEHVVISLTDEGKYASILREGGVKVEALGMISVRASIGHFWQLIKMIRAEKPDVVQTWMYHADLIGGLAARFAGIRNVIWGIRQTTLGRAIAKKSTIAIARVCSVLSYIVPKKIVCCAEKAQKAHVGLGYCKNKMMVIPNGYDLCKLKPSTEARTRIRAQIGVDSEEFLLGMVGRYHPQKDHKNLLESLVLLNKWGYSIRCALVGTGLTAENQELRRMISKMGLDNTVLLSGPRRDIPDFMNALDAHVLSSFSEGFPNVVAEAMACGIPCVSTDVGDASVIIGDTGFLCPPENAEALARAIASSLEERLHYPETYFDRGERSRARVMARYSLNHTVQLYELAWNLGD
ncbi:glycosyltransferase family 4 protein [Marinobacter sp.]|uniref:glycosyltransferase family 4 protein n=1 Tax=Marinobacter sp. TaxID=50741 RepID=UPI002B264D9E|nr:glycosyltransferase [Marinobacter sp.]